MNIDVSGSGIQVNEEIEIMQTSCQWHDRLSSGEIEYSGWVNMPKEFDKELLEDIKKTAEEIKNKCTILIVVGIGGSYLGAKAVIDALNGSKNGYPEIIFAGFNMSAAYLNKIVNRMKTEATCMCVISKSGTTVEPLLTYSILKDKMFAKYGYEDARRRIYVITDEKKGDLRPEAFENQFKSFAIPKDIGGRYSVLTVVGLLPIAAAGHDVEALISGAKTIAEDKQWKNSLLDYTISRVALQNKGKMIEVFEYFESNLRYFGEWLKQLFGESEGKDGKGAYPTCLCFSRDLHSMGQFLQQGSQIFYETMIRIKESDYDFDIPWYAGYPYAGKTLETINDCSEEGVIIAHKKSGIPIIAIELPSLNEYHLGQLIYFFEMSCALSAYNIGVNPFDQPGVENYKEEMRKLVELL